MTMKQFVRRLIVEMGVSQKQFADAVGVHEKSLSRYLCKPVKPGKRLSIGDKLTDILFKDCMAALLAKAREGRHGQHNADA